MPSFLFPVLARPDVGFGLNNVRTGTAVAELIETAFDSSGRNRGLLGRTELESGHALVLAPCSSIHTWFMKFPIDVVFVARDGHVRKVSANVEPWRIRLGLGAFAVVELPAGTAAARDLRAGDRLELFEVEKRHVGAA